MTSPKENAENFVKIWRMETPADIARIYIELHGTAPEIGLEVEREIQESMQASGRSIYSASSDDFRRRNSNEYTQLILQIFREAARATYFTEPFQQYLEDLVKSNLVIGRPSESDIPLHLFGIYPEEGRYDPHDPNADLRGIEGKFLEADNHAMTQIAYPEVMQEEIELNRRWNEAYNQKYQNPPISK